MSTPASPNDSHARAQRDVVALALGEVVDATVAAHVSQCPLCQQEIEAYRQVADLARHVDRDLGPAEPSAELWDRIVTELGTAAPLSVVPTPSAVPAREAPRRWRRALLAAAAVVAVAGAGVAGWAIGHSGSGGGTNRSAQAALAAQPGTAGTAHGAAVVHTSSDGYLVSVSSSGLPAPEGYYEVWLFNPSINQMVAIGTLGTDGRGTFTVPGGIDLRAYHIVDVSAQKYDGNNAHERSVLRGPLSG